MDSLEAVLARLETLPIGVQDEVRVAVRAVLDVVGPGVVDLLEVSPSVPASPAVSALLELCGLLPGPTPVPVALSAGPRCATCGGRLPGDHAHRADVDARTLLCVCRGCASSGPGMALGTASRLVADAVEAPAWWATGEVPVGVAFVLRPAEGPCVVGYPGRAGVVESTLDVDPPIGWSTDVEALLVLAEPRRFRAWVVPVDRCYELAGRLRHASPHDADSVVAAFVESLAVA